MNQDKIYEMVLEKSVEKILTWSFSDDHPLEKCSTETKEIIQHSADLAKQGRYDEAIVELNKAAQQEPGYVGSRVRTMKYLTKKDRPLQALLVGGGVLALSNDSKPRSQVWDMASGIALDLYKQTNNILHLNEALDFANEATNAEADDVINAWNRLDVLLHFHNHLLKQNKDDEAEHYLSQSKLAIEHIIRFAENGTGNVSGNWHLIIKDAENSFPDDEWWNEKLNIMRSIEIPTSDEDDGSKIIQKPSISRKVMRFAATLAVLCMPVLFDSIANTEKITSSEEQTHEAINIDSTNEKPQFKDVENEDKDKHNLARIERDDIELARVDRDDIELASQMIKSWRVQLARIERDDDKLA